MATLDPAEFETLFAGDLEPQRIEFTVTGAPESAWVELQPMDSRALARYATHGVKYRVPSGDAAAAEVESIDFEARTVFLVCATLRDFRLWRRSRPRNPGEGPEFIWTEVRPPQGDRERERFIESTFRCTPDFWGWLVQRCLDVNGLAENQQGN